MHADGREGDGDGDGRTDPKQQGKGREGKVGRIHLVKMVSNRFGVRMLEVGVASTPS